jgi:hypothetical protein
VHLGATPAGGRSIFPVKGGSFKGDRLSGTGADWVTWRSDGAMIIDVRLALQTERTVPSFLGVFLSGGRAPATCARPIP